MKKLILIVIIFSHFIELANAQLANNELGYRNNTSSTLLSFTNSGQNLATFATDVVLGDFNLEIGLDALISKSNAPDRVFFNNGLGILSLSDPLQNIGLGGLTRKMVVGDFDVLTGNNDVFLVKLVGELWTNDNSGTYLSANLSQGNNVITADSFDINGDLADDLIIVTNSGIDVYLNNVFATFPMISFILVQSIPETNINDIKIAFVNYDNYPDIILARNGQNKAYLGNNTNTFNTTLSQDFNFNNNDSRSIDVLDFNNDGIDDLFLFANYSDFTAQENEAYITNSTGTSFLDIIIPDTQDTSNDVAFADFDNDGDTDIVFANDGPNVIWESTPGGWTEVLSLGNADSKGVDVGDIDGDGDIDIIFANNDSIGSQIWFNNLQSLSNDEFELNNNFKIYPNPIINKFKVSTDNDTIEKLEVYNLQGQLIKQFSPTHNYDISELDSGIYLIKLYAQKSVGTVKILKN